MAASLLNTVTRLRMAELRDNLQSANEKNDDLRNVALLSRIALINERALSGGRETAQSYRQEAESALLAIRQSRNRGREIGLTDRLALPFLNGFNRIIGLPRLHLGKTPEQELVLDLAFQFESFREYGKAVRGYTVYLNEFSLSPEEKDFALLHRGFCHAMQNQFEAAVNDFSLVEKSSSARNASTAHRLSKFLTDLRARIQLIESVRDPARRGEMYYQAAAYYKALENFTAMEGANRSERVRFLTARSYEETGQTQKALAIYRDLVKSAPQSQYAVNSNRRMYLLGTFLGHDENLSRESKTNSETVVKDHEFIKAVTHLEKSATALHTEAAAERAAETTELAAVERLVLPPEPAPPAAPKAEPPAVKQEPEPEPLKPAPPIAKPRAANLRNESEARRAEGLPVEKKEALLRAQEQKIDRLTMIDGNIFYGVVYKEDTEHVWIYSVLGNLELKKADITKRDKVAGSSAIK